jgi:hypothetical protein
LNPAAVSGAEVLLDKGDRQEDARVRFRMAAGILETLEEHRMPPRIVAALAAASERKVVVKHRVKAVWEGISKTPAMLTAWNEACRSGPFVDGGRIVVMLFGREKDARKRSATIFGQCQLGSAGLLKLDDLSLDYDMVMLAHAMKSFLAKRGGVHEVEERALAMLARGEKAASPVFAADELPAMDPPTRLTESMEKPLHERLRAGVALLKTGATKKFFDQIVHPHELGGLRVDDAVKTFSRKGKTKPLLQALELAVDRPARDDGEGEASIPLPWRPEREARERLRFQLHKGVWYLRL